MFATLSLVPQVIPASHAYGQAQWQVGFSGNFLNQTSLARFGFWGWCDFAGSTAGGSSGTQADCENTFYAFNGTVGAHATVLLQESIQGTAWSMQPTSMPIPGLPPNDFFITSGTVTVAGPVVFPHTGSGQPVTFTVAQAEAIGLFNPDTGNPAKAGHYSLANIFEMFGIPVPPGTHVDIQVAQIA